MDRRDALPDDLQRIVTAAMDLGYYRTQPDSVADDLARSVAFELADRVSKLPEVAALESAPRPRRRRR